MIITVFPPLHKRTITSLNDNLRYCALPPALVRGVGERSEPGGSKISKFNSPSLFASQKSSPLFKAGAKEVAYRWYAKR